MRITTQLKLIVTLFLSSGFCLTTLSYGQQLSGTVKDPDGIPLIGVNVLVPGQDLGTVTDLDGTYQLDVNGGDTLMFRYVGFASQKVAIDERPVVDVVLEEASALLDEVVVIGYGVQQKADITGAVASVEKEAITRIATPSVEQALQGRIAGVQVTPISGTPGADAVVRIRGIGTFNNASPLYVVDGMLLDDIAFLNPNDIERIDVLKDASAAAIYGSRGANGVILITTKLGTGEAGTSSINVDVYRGQQQLIRKINLVDADGFALLANQLARNENRAIPYPDSTGFAETTDWQDEIFQSAPITSYQISASGSGVRGNYLVSANHIEQEGIVKGGDFSRTTVRFNADYQLRPRVTLGQNLAFSLRRSVNGPGILSNGYRGWPTLPLRDSLGGFADTAPVGNPLAQLAFQNSTGSQDRVVGSAFVSYRPIDGLELKSSFAVDRATGRDENFTPVFFVSPLQQNEINNYSLSNATGTRWVWENTVNYNRTLGESRFGILAGITAQEERSEAVGGSVQGLAEEFEEFRFLSNGVDSTQTTFSNAGESSLLSYLGRVNYSYGDRYLLTASLRVDGSSKFGQENRYGFFPSAAVGWRIDQEDFWNTQGPINRLKLRLGYGVIGNERIGNYPSVPQVAGQLNAVFGATEAIQYGATPTTLANPNLRWESTTSSNIGLEIGVFEDRLTAEVDYYIKTTDDILLTVPIPDFVGANPPIVNAASIRNSGIEVLLNWRDRVGRLGYNVSLNGASVDNEVLSLGQGNEELLGGAVEGGRFATRSVVGEPVGSFYGYEVIGVIQDQRQLEDLPTREGQMVGDLLFADINGDSVITAEDRTFLGSPIPDFTFGASFGVDAYGFDLSVDFYGQVGAKVYNAKRMDRFNTYNFESIYLASWTGPGTSNTEPRLTNGGGNYDVSQRFLQSGDFVRLRNVTLGYSLPAKLNSRLRLQSLRLYASGTNLAIWDSYRGYTPEISTGSVIDNGIDRGVYPVPRTVNVGLQVGF